MDQIVTQVPAFEPIHSQVFGNLRELRSENSLYVKAMDELKIALGKALRDSDREAINRLINEFAAELSARRRTGCAQAGSWRNTTRWRGSWTTRSCRNSCV